MAQYQGHPSWNAWNVSLWIGNDESLYNFAIECLRKPTLKGKEPSLNVAATRFLNLVSGRTPDGARYSRTSVRHALDGLRDDATIKLTIDPVTPHPKGWEFAG